MKKMNKLQKFLLAAFAMIIGFFAAVGISLNAMTACAEKSTESTEILDNSATDEEVIDSENSFVYDAVGNVYYYVDPTNATNTIKFEILESGKLKIYMYQDGNAFATVYGKYYINDNYLEVYVDNEVTSQFILYQDGRAIEYVEEEDSGVLDEETDTETDNSAILDEIKNYLDSRKDENGKIDFKMILTDVKYWIIQVISFVVQTGVGAAILGLINRKNKKDNILTDAHVEIVATAAANKAVEKVVGKSIDVDISAEVSKAVKKELYTLSAAMDNLVDGVKNTEMLVAREAVALSHSRILGANEKTALVEGAKKAEAHAGKVVSAAKIKIEATEPSTKSSTEKTESVEEKNMQYFNFDGVEKK